VVALAVAFLPFVLHLPRPQRVAALAAAALFVVGALGLEMVGAAAASAEGTDSPRYIASAIAEETLEFAGTALFLVTLYSLLAVWAPVLTVRHPAGAGADNAPSRPTSAGPSRTVDRWGLARDGRLTRRSRS